MESTLDSVISNLWDRLPAPIMDYSEFGSLGGGGLYRWLANFANNTLQHKAVTKFFHYIRFVLSGAHVRVTARSAPIPGKSVTKDVHGKARITEIPP